MNNNINNNNNNNNLTKQMIMLIGDYYPEKGENIIHSLSVACERPIAK